MSDATLSVPTAFTDVSQLSEGLADRVDEERIMLYGPVPVDEGAWVHFAVTLVDESIALEGMGRAIASIDGGAERPEVARYDIVLDSLQLNSTSTAVYERILLLRAEAFSGQPSTEELEVEELHDPSAPPAEAAVDEAVGFENYAAPPAAPNGQWEAASSEAIAVDDFVESVPPSSPPQEELAATSGPTLATARSGILGRASHQAAWYPEVVSAPQPRPASEMFLHGSGLPVPSAPPRPQLDPSLRIQPAPRPGPGAAEFTRSAGADTSASAGEEPLDSDLTSVNAALPEVADHEIEALDAHDEPSSDLEDAVVSVDGAPLGEGALQNADAIGDIRYDESDLTRVDYESPEKR